MCYEEAPCDLPARCDGCDGCDVHFTLQHTLPHQKGGLVIFCHNKYADTSRILGWALPLFAPHTMYKRKPSPIAQNQCWVPPMGRGRWLILIWMLDLPRIRTILSFQAQKISKKTHYTQHSTQQRMDSTEEGSQDQDQDVGLRRKDACRRTRRNAPWRSRHTSCSKSPLWCWWRLTFLMDKDRAQVFHTFVAKTLFLCKHSRPDLQTALAPC